MTYFDCKKMHSKCKAQCCGVVPIPKDVYEKNQDKIVRKPHLLIDAGVNVIPITKDAYCPFLTEKLDCNIYDDRPTICRKFGDETHPMLCCPCLDKNGKIRSKKNQNIMEIKSKEFLNRLRIL